MLGYGVIRSTLKILGNTAAVGTYLRHDIDWPQSDNYKLFWTISFHPSIAKRNSVDWLTLYYNTFAKPIKRRENYYATFYCDHTQDLTCLVSYNKHQNIFSLIIWWARWSWPKLNPNLMLFKKLVEEILGQHYLLHVGQLLYKFILQPGGEARSLVNLWEPAAYLEWRAFLISC